MGLHLAAPALALRARDVEVPEQRELLFVLGLHALEEEGDTDRRADGQERRERVVDEVEQA